MAVQARSAIVARVRDRNPIEVANDLGHRFGRLLPYGRRCGNRFMHVARAVAARNALLVELGFKGGSITMIRSRWFLIPFLLSVLLADTGMSQDQAVAVSAGQDGTAQITLANGEKIAIPKEPGQVGISESHIGPDGTVGWLAEYKVEGVSYPIAGTLIIWRAGKNIERVNKKALGLLQSYPWPGNIRELQNVIERSMILCETEIFSIDENWLPQPPPMTPEPKQQVELTRRLLVQEKDMIEEALKASRGRVFGPMGAATKLGIPRSTLESKIKSLKIDKNRFRTLSEI